MGAHVLSNLLNELRKNIRCEAFELEESIFLLISNRAYYKQTVVTQTTQ